MLTKKQEIAVNYVLKDFNFEKVSKAMRLFDWKWGYQKEEHFPLADEIENSARRLLTELLTSNYEKIESGGLVARINHDESMGDILVLEFVLECGQGGRLLS